MDNLNNWPLGGSYASLRSPHLGILPGVGEMPCEASNARCGKPHKHSTMTQGARMQDGQWSSYPCLTT